MKTLNIKSPLDAATIKSLRSGDQVLITGVIYVARDAAHQRLVETLDQGKPLPFDMRGQTIYYMGPTPAKPGQVIGAAGPTTSGRMDIYSPRLMAAGLRAMIGKGRRAAAVKKAMKKYKAVYLAAVGGTGALIAQNIKKSEIIAYEEMGAEAVLRIEVANFPAIVINDIYGGDLYEEGKAQYQVEK